MGKEAGDIMVSFRLTADDAKQYELVKNRFESHFIVKRNIIFERAKFNLRSQQEGESVETFITDLHCLALSRTVSLIYTVNLAYLRTNLSEIK